MKRGPKLLEGLIAEPLSQVGYEEPIVVGTSVLSLNLQIFQTGNSRRKH